MRKALVILAVVALFSSMASAQMFYPTRDAAINRAGGEEYASGGALTQARAAKYRQHYALMDFDWAAIEAAGAAYASPVYKLSMVAVAGDDRLDGVWARIVISGNSVDWVVGDGNSQFSNFSWTAPDVNPAVTSQYAQTLAMDDPANPGTWIVDPVASTGSWPWGDFDGPRSAAGQYNFAPLIFGLGGVRAEVVLDQIVPLLFSGTDAVGNPVRGIYTWDMNNLGSNGEAYLSEAGTDLSPRIEVVPEPASLLLISFGGVGLLLRKKR